MIKDAKSKASRTTNEVVRETFSIKRCQSSIAFKEGESAQRILTLVAVVAAGGSTGIVAGSSTGGGRSLAPLFPNNLRIHHAAGNHLTATITLHFGQKRTRTPLISEALTSAAVDTPLLVEVAV